MELKRIAIADWLHKRIKIAASIEGISIREWAESALKRKLEEKEEVGGR